MISNQSRPMEVSRELYDYYIRHENGRELLEGVKVFPGTTEAEAAGGAGQKEVRTPFCGCSLFCVGFLLDPPQRLRTRDNIGRRM